MILENQLSSPILPDVNIHELIEGGEGNRVEFKSTFQWDVKKGEHNKGLKHQVIKTLAAFNNTEGGDLLIGVNDEGSLFGLEKDYSLLSKKNKDGFLLALTQEIENKISKEFASAVKIDIQNKEEKDIFWVRVNFGKDCVWVRKNKTEKIFYIRSQNKSIPIDPEEAADYIRRKWPLK
jgi:predicted HTH transcriptional regulator